ncbi:MAG: M13 family metallopeptidase [Deltaproteobacteria bacterium]|nr:M13 family metallopeptidase [Deltaproteobacteria bacterium]
MKKIVLLSFAVLAGCAAQKPETQATPKQKATKVTKAPNAPKVTGIDLASIDRTADPCKDFYQFACGGWINSHKIPADKARWGTFDELAEKDLKKLHDICENAAAGKSDPDDRFGKKVGDFYAACMDEEGIEKKGLENLKTEWQKLDSISKPASFASAVAHLHRIGVGAVFDLEAMQDFKDSTKVVAWIFQGGLTLPDRDYYLKTDDKSKEIQKNYRSYIKQMLVLAGCKEKKAAKKAEKIFNLEKSLARSYWTRTEMRDPHRIYNPMSKAELKKTCPNFDWQTYFNDLHISEKGIFAVSTPKALKHLSSLIAKPGPKTWKTYLKWRVLDTLARARALPKKFTEEHFAFVSKNFTGAKEMEPRWKHCTKMTDKMLGEALGQAFVRRWFPPKAKKNALQLIRNIQQAMHDNLEHLGWMDQQTREKAISKLSKIANKIGYPDKWRDYSSVQIDRKSYFGSLSAAATFETNREIAKIGKPVDRTEWEMTPPTVNAYYEPQLNEMVFPAGILQPVFYTQGANDAVNYGGIGFVMGHELTHGFDDQGRKFDAQGNMADWWSPDVSKKFEDRASCVVKQFSNYVAVDNLKLNGKLTLGENIADLGGLKLSFSAYKTAHKNTKPEPNVGGFSPQQQFFLSAAQVWCSKSRPEYARKMVVVDPHSPPKWRVNGPLSNLADFSKAFSCKPGDPMSPKERCQVW